MESCGAAVGDGYFGSSRHRDASSIIGSSRAWFRVFTDKVAYANVRFVRALAVALELPIRDTPRDWALLCRMSPSVRGLCCRWGVDHAAAIVLRDAMRSCLNVLSERNKEITPNCN